MPFEFVVAGQTLPAGDYTVISDPATSTMKLINQGTNQVVAIFTSEDRRSNNAGSRLIFVKEGKRHVLHQFWKEGDGHGHDVVHGIDVVELRAR